MKKYMAIFLTMALVSLLCSCSGLNGRPGVLSSVPSLPTANVKPVFPSTPTPEPSVTKYELIFSDSYPSDHPFNTGILNIAKLVKEKTDGQVIINVFPSSQLTDEDKLAGFLSDGRIDIAILGVNDLEKMVKDFSVFDYPYIVSTYDKPSRILNSEPLKPLLSELKNNDSINLSAFLYIGSCNITTLDDPVDKPDDLKGKSFYPILGTNIKSSFEGLTGAKSIEVGTSAPNLKLKSGEVAAAESLIILIRQDHLYEVQKYLNLTEHNLLFAPLCISDNVRYKLPSNLYQILIDTINEEAPNISKAVYDDEQTKLQWLESAGITVHIPASMGKFYDNALSIVKKGEDSGALTPGLYKAVKAVK